MKAQSRLLVLFAFLAFPAAAWAQREFAGTTTLVGSEGGLVRFHLSSPATLMFNPLADVQGAGDFVGFALSPDPVQLTVIPPYPPFPKYGTILVGGMAAGELFYTNFTSSPQLQVGNYLLYLLADGSPSRVTLRFPELSGVVEVDAAVPVPFDARFLPSIVTVEEAQTIYSAGSTGDLTAPGLGLTLLWVNGREVLEDFYLGNSGLYGNCLYNHQVGDPPPDETIAYLPGCPWLPQSEYLFVFPAVETPGIAGIVLAWLNYLSAGRWGQGLWYATPSLVESAGGVAFWLSLEAPFEPVPVRPATWGQVKSLYR